MTNELKSYIITNIIGLMGKRGPKPKFTDVSCPNQKYKFYQISGKENIVGNGTYQIKNKRIHKYICHECGRVFNDRTGTFFDNLRKDEFRDFPLH